MVFILAMPGIFKNMYLVRNEFYNNRPNYEYKVLLVLIMHCNVVFSGKFVLVIFQKFCLWQYEYVYSIFPYSQKYFLCG